MTELCQIADKYNTDKSPSKGGHSYTPFYHFLFDNQRDQIKTVLEIGIGWRGYMNHHVMSRADYVVGASLRMWRDYFRNAQIYGIDIYPQALFEDERVHTFLCDQSSPYQLIDLCKNEIKTTLDIVIDDGSHFFQHQIISLFTLFDYISPGGVYLIEDIISKSLPLYRAFISGNYIAEINEFVSVGEFRAFTERIQEIALVQFPQFPQNVEDNNILKVVLK